MGGSKRGLIKRGRFRNKICIVKWISGQRGIVKVICCSNIGGFKFPRLVVGIDKLRFVELN
ncbi:50S ribosomal protein L24 [Candidatus Hodgkinia cicadicola]|uniref:50S ribosomal protein L24 n=1 Tax=Candidatus Hodgkinia cicadicola TaxID=573658 RepID=A0ABX4MH76_9HYPH|nr:50S ribosomal protein L24 [Candidatus Hodgkinia cicadicola]